MWTYGVCLLLTQYRGTVMCVSHGSVVNDGEETRNYSPSGMFELNTVIALVDYRGLTGINRVRSETYLIPVSRCRKYIAHRSTDTHLVP